jgi:predicted enzyme related to lactoylglutathione lyase
MAPSHFVLLLVESPEASADFYSKLLQSPPIEASATFAMFALGEGLMLGLWAKNTVEPKPAGAPGASELAFVLPGDAAVDAECKRWEALGVRIVQRPQKMDFGYTCTAVDPDGHRLRAFAPGE